MEEENLHPDGNTNTPERKGKLTPQQQAELEVAMEWWSRIDRLSNIVNNPDYEEGGVRKKFLQKKRDEIELERDVLHRTLRELNIQSDYQTRPNYERDKDQLSPTQESTQIIIEGINTHLQKLSQQESLDGEVSEIDLHDPVYVFQTIGGVRTKVRDYTIAAERLRKKFEERLDEFN